MNVLAVFKKSRTRVGISANYIALNDWHQRTIQKKGVNLQGKLNEKTNSAMALEIRSIPVLEGATAERFVREAEENARNPKKSRPRFLSLSDFEQIEKNSTAREQARKHG